LEPFGAAEGVLEPVGVGKGGWSHLGRGHTRGRPIGRGGRPRGPRARRGPRPAGARAGCRPRAASRSRGCPRTCIPPAPAPASAMGRDAEGGRGPGRSFPNKHRRGGRVAGTGRGGGCGPAAVEGLARERTARHVARGGEVGSVPRHWERRPVRRGVGREPDGIHVPDRRAQRTRAPHQESLAPRRAAQRRQRQLQRLPRAPRALSCHATCRARGAPRQRGGGRAWARVAEGSWRAAGRAAAWRKSSLRNEKPRPRTILPARVSPRRAAYTLDEA